MINVWKKLLISLGILVIICSTIFLLRNYSFVDEGTKENLVYEQKKIISNFKNCKSSPLKIKFPNYWKFPQKWNSIISKWDECFGEIIAEDQFYYS